MEMVKKPNSIIKIFNSSIALVFNEKWPNEQLKEALL